MPECDMCRAEGAKQRCRKCHGCWSCDKKCAKRFWPIHKKFCTDDPALRPYVPTELAVERAMAQATKFEVAPKDHAVTCYICLEGGGDANSGSSSPDDEEKNAGTICNTNPIVRACACRGPSAGFAHVDCLAEMASRDPFFTGGDGKTFERWTNCTVCTHLFQGRLWLEMARRRWRHDRSVPHQKDTAIRALSVSLESYGEMDACNRLVAQVTRLDPTTYVGTELLKAHSLRLRKRYTDAIDHLARLRPSMELYATPGELAVYADEMGKNLCMEDRLDEALVYSKEAAERMTESQGAESPPALSSVRNYATILTLAGQTQEAIAILTRLLATHTRVLGADHPETLSLKEFLTVATRHDATRRKKKKMMITLTL